MSRLVTVVDVVATLNMKNGVADRHAIAGIDRTLLAAGSPADAIGLQEVGRRRGRRLLKHFRAYSWHRPLLGGGPVGLHRQRYVEKRTRGVTLAMPGRVDRSPGRRRFLGRSVATLVIAVDLLTGEEVAFVDYHLTAEVEHDGRDRNRDGYRDDRPLRVKRHKREVRRLQRLIARQRAKGRVVYPMGDGNLDELELDGVVSAWAGRTPQGTKGGRRTIDDVHGPCEADRVVVVPTASDHHGVVTVRERVVEAAA